MMNLIKELAEAINAPRHKGKMKNTRAVLVKVAADQKRQKRLLFLWCVLSFVVGLYLGYIFL